MVSAVDEPTKLYISNLDYGVSNADIKELFSDVGHIKRYSINYYRSGRSKGTAEVVFSRRSDALAAVERYNNVQLDGRPMQIEIIGTNIEEPPQPTATFSFGLSGTIKMAHSRPMAYAGYGVIQPEAPMVFALDEPTKLYISNLDYGVSNTDIKELFSDVGHIKRYSINYHRSGRSKGTAEVIFSRRSDALAAVERYNNVQLDGRPMQIEIIGTNIEAPPPPTATFSFSLSGTIKMQGSQFRKKSGRASFL